MTAQGHDQIVFSRRVMDSTLPFSPKAHTTLQLSVQGLFPSPFLLSPLPSSL